MSGAIIAGLIITLMFLVSFSEWFYHLFVGIDTLVLRDVFFYYRAAGWIFGALLFMAAVFWLIALISECPLSEAKVGLFRYLNCNLYLRGQNLLGQLGLTLPPPSAPE